MIWNCENNVVTDDIFNDVEAELKIITVFILTVMTLTEGGSFMINLNTLGRDSPF